MNLPVDPPSFNRSPFGERNMVGLSVLWMVLLLLPAQAVRSQTTTLDFEDVPSSPGVVPGVISKGFSLSNSFGVYVASGPSYCSPECPGGSGHYIIAQGSLPTGPVTLQRQDGQPFSLISFDFAETNVNVGYPPEIHVEGLGSAGGPVTFSVALDGVNDGSGPLTDFQRAFLPEGFRNLRSVNFTGSTGTSLDRFNYSLDNIQVSSETAGIPILDTWTRVLFGLLLGLAGALVLRRG